MGNCCDKKSRNNTRSPLLEVKNQSGGGKKVNDNYDINRNNNNNYNGDDESNNVSNESKLNNNKYNPPVAAKNIPKRKSSFKTSPAQIESNVLEFPRKKSGEMKKLGHVMKNWRRRFFVLEGYYSYD
jgi:hypothetical protein